MPLQASADAQGGRQAGPRDSCDVPGSVPGSALVGRVVSQVVSQVPRDSCDVPGSVPGGALVGSLVSQVAGQWGAPSPCKGPMRSSPVPLACRAGEMIPEEEGTRPWGAPGKRVPSVSKGPKPPIPLLQMLKNGPREVKRAHFRYILGPPGPTQEMDFMEPGGEGPSRSPRFLRPCLHAH